MKNKEMAPKMSFLALKLRNLEFKFNSFLKMASLPLSLAPQMRGEWETSLETQKVLNIA